ncbi:MAG: nucleotidyltransferase [Rhodothermaceae bacterium]|nr:MAG: nucleotidyltransferase [Rhodothermaceae bacterium]
MQTPDTTSVNHARDDLVRQIVALVHPLRIYVFGSAARGQTHAGSDIDFLVVMPEGTPRRRTAQYLYEHLTGHGVPFDVLVTTPGHLRRYADHPGLIYRTILREGHEVYAA